METRKPKWKNREAFFAPPDPEPLRRCDHPECDAEGSHRAPKSRDRLGEFHWFCIDHVREYNARWDFFGGMSEAEIEAARRRDTTWNRPSWPFGTQGVAEGAQARGRNGRDWNFSEDDLRAAFRRAFDADEAGSDDARRRKAWFEQKSTEQVTAEEEALSVLDLDYPVDFATVKARYKSLVKEHHPDRNGGSRAAEEKLKSINLAYSTLKTSMAS